MSGEAALVPRDQDMGARERMKRSAEESSRAEQERAPALARQGALQTLLSYLIPPLLLPRQQWPENTHQLSFAFWPSGKQPWAACHKTTLTSASLRGQELASQRWTLPDHHDYHRPPGEAAKTAS